MFYTFASNTCSKEGGNVIVVLSSIVYFHILTANIEYAMLNVRHVSIARVAVGN